MLIESKFIPAKGFRDPHRQTITASIFRRRPKVTLVRERIELDDGDFLDLDWGEKFPDRPLVLVLHGLEGNSESKYAAGILAALAKNKFNAVLLHSRGCSGEPNRLVKSYHAGGTDDMAFIATLVKERFANVPLYAVGYSLGANALLKWLGETGLNNPIDAAAAVSAPFDLSACATRLESGLSQIYQTFLLRKMKEAARAKRDLLSTVIDFPDLGKIKTFTKFDQLITAPIHGFSSAEDYYQSSSCKQYLPGIKKPTVILQSLDDPFMYAHSGPTEQDLSETTTFEWSRFGGHVGFISIDKEHPYWLEKRIPEWLESQIAR